MHIISLKKILASSVIYTIGDMLSVVVSGFLLIPVYLHYMSPDDYGLFSSVNILSSMFGIVFLMGLHSAATRYFYVYRKTKKEFEYLGNIWIAHILFTFAGVSLLLLIGPKIWHFISPAVPYKPFYIFVFAGVLLSFSAGVYPIWLRIQEKSTAFVFLQLARMAVLLVLILVFLVWLKLGAIGALSAVLGASVFSAVISFICLGRCLKCKLKFGYVKDSLQFGVLIMLGTVGYILMQKSQIFVLQRYCELSDVGVFNLGLQLGSVLIITFASFGKAWQPLIYSAADRQVANNAIRKISKYFFFAATYIVLALLLFSKEIILLIARPEFFGAVPILKLIILASFFYVCTSLPASSLMYSCRVAPLQICIWIMFLLNISLSVFMIPKWKLIGSAWSMVIVFFLYSVAVFILAQRDTKVDYDKDSVFKILVAGGAIFFVSLAVSPNFSVLFQCMYKICLLISYPIILFIAHVFSWEKFTVELAKLRSKYGLYLANQER